MICSMKYHLYIGQILNQPKYVVVNTKYGLSDMSRT